MTASSAPILVPVRPNHRIDEAALAAYVRDRVHAFDGPMTVRQFQGGQSNPTYHLQAGDRQLVVRKKPPGKLLPSAHAVDREYQVMKALWGSGVPVPKVHVLCTDEAVLGQWFYVMDYVEGRVFADPLAPDAGKDERAAMYREMATVMAKLHQVDYRAVGLSEFGKPTAYIARQVARWSKQYDASKTDDVPSMTKLMAWLPEHIPPGDESAIVHGDYRLGNLLIHPAEPRVVAVLDWELATIGHPLADLAYNCMSYHLKRGTSRGFADLDLASYGIPGETDYVGLYCKLTGRGDIPHWEFYVAYALFRIAAILQGVYKRGLDGNASDAGAVQVGGTFRAIADHAWSLVERARG
ncbi:MAG: phosphotransferase family protein [Alphaproteobacteria bacterium]|nr:phosphotransferase family protein [Alphaproteobacteria bacterium]